MFFGLLSFFSATYHSVLGLLSCLFYVCFWSVVYVCLLVWNPVLLLLCFFWFVVLLLLCFFLAFCPVSTMFVFWVWCPFSTEFACWFVLFCCPASTMFVFWFVLFCCPASTTFVFWFVVLLLLRLFFGLSSLYRFYYFQLIYYRLCDADRIGAINTKDKNEKIKNK